MATCHGRPSSSQAAAPLAPGDGVPLMNLGRAYLRSGDAARAADVLRRSIAAEPYSFYAQLNLARAALALGDTATAAAALDACSRIRPGLERLFSTEQEVLNRQGGRPQLIVATPQPGTDGTQSERR